MCARARYKYFYVVKICRDRRLLSDAEDFTEGYRSLKLGKTVGEPTAGWIIFTWNVGLFDGTNVRLPRQLVLDSDGKDMELNEGIRLLTGRPKLALPIAEKDDGEPAATRLTIVIGRFLGCFAAPAFRAAGGDAGNFHFRPALGADHLGARVLVQGDQAVSARRTGKANGHVGSLFDVCAARLDCPPPTE